MIFTNKQTNKQTNDVCLYLWKLIHRRSVVICESVAFISVYLLSSNNKFNQLYTNRE